MAIGRIGRLSDVRALLGGISRPTIDRLEASDAGFPKRIRLGRSAVGWDLDAVRVWLEQRPRGPKPPDCDRDDAEAEAA
jgi:predicted DNA-binding transcriptional regulator AlpA